MVMNDTQACQACSICAKSSPGSIASNEQALSYATFSETECMHASVFECMYLDVVAQVSV